MTPCKNAEAVKELLSWTEKNDYLKVLGDLWEGWLCSEDIGASMIEVRSHYLATYKELRKFFGSIDTV